MHAVVKVSKSSHGGGKACCKTEAAVAWHWIGAMPRCLNVYRSLDRMESSRMGFSSESQTDAKTFLEH